MREVKLCSRAHPQKIWMAQFQHPTLGWNIIKVYSNTSRPHWKIEHVNLDFTSIMIISSVKFIKQKYVIKKVKIMSNTINLLVELMVWSHCISKVGHGWIYCKGDDSLSNKKGSIVILLKKQGVFGIFSISHLSLQSRKRRGRKRGYSENFHQMRGYAGIGDFKRSSGC